MNFRAANRSAGRIPRLPLVALIDVVLFLLMYFMLATDLGGAESALSSALQTDASPAGSSGGGLRPQIVRVEHSEGADLYRIGDRVFQDEQSLRAVLEQLAKDRGVIVRVDPQVKIESAAAALQACKDAGFVKVSYVPGRN